MKNRRLTGVVFAAWLGFVALAAGCASSTPTSSSTTSAVKPIDKVRDGIVAVRSQLDATVADARVATYGTTAGLRANKEAYSRELRGTEQQVLVLRSDAAELKQRASEYLVVWGGQTTVMGADGSVGNKTNEPRQAVSVKYDEMVDALQHARDIALPLLSDFQKLERALRDTMSALELQALRPEVERMASQEMRVAALLDTAVARLDELKTLAGTANAGTPRGQ